MPLTVAIVFGLIEAIIMKCSYNMAYKIQVEDTPEKTKERKTIKTIENEIESFYYVLTFILGTILIQ